MTREGYSYSWRIPYPTGEKELNKFDEEIGGKVLRLPKSQLEEEEGDGALYGYVWFSQEQVSSTLQSCDRLTAIADLCVSRFFLELLPPTKLLSTFPSPPHASSTPPRSLLFSTTNPRTLAFPPRETIRCERWHGRKCLFKHCELANSNSGEYSRVTFIR